jgi:hypothetical protein
VGSNVVAKQGRLERFLLSAAVRSGTGVAW